MNYEQKYKNALLRASKLRVQNPFDTVGQMVEHIFPELKESEDERIQKSLIKAFGTIGKKDWGGLIVRDILAWLEKQRDYDRLIEEMKKRKELLSKEKEKATSTNDKLSLGGRIAMLQELLAFNICNTTDKVEPKFKVGDWVVQENIGTYKVIEVCESWYEVIDNQNNHYSIGFDKEDMCHLWTINDAKDGDVLLEEEIGEPFIYNGNRAIHFLGVHCGIYNGEFNPYGGIHHCGKNSHPATKEQRDLLFQKIKEAGYQWDNEKKELKKMEVVSKESEDEKVRKALVELVKCNERSGYTLLNNVSTDSMLAWLEKQGKQ